MKNHLTLRYLCLCGLTLLLSACTSYGVIQNRPVHEASAVSPSYSLGSFSGKLRNNENALMLAFSGGGTRAAALAYGVLQALRDTPIRINGQTLRMLDEVDSISSVSGGSFTAAYYGLHGDGLFENFERVFLRQNIERSLIRGVLNPLRWFNREGRTEMAVEFFQDTVFGDASFADLLRQKGPMIIINASDLGHGVRFSFLQEYFNLLCSDLSTFPVARAVAASSAVPILFNPVVVENHPGCGTEWPQWLKEVNAKSADEPEFDAIIKGITSYLERDKRRYIHFVDGGITDNLGLRAYYDLITVAGGARKLAERFNLKAPERLIILSVNASTNPELEMDRSSQQPSLEETIDALSDAQLHRYNISTVELINRSIVRWAQELSTPKRVVRPYFIRIDLSAVKQHEQRRLLNLIPTSFSLSDEHVDQLISTGRYLLSTHPEYQRLLADMEVNQ